MKLPSDKVKILIIIILSLVILNLFNIRVLDMPLFFIMGQGITFSNILIVFGIAWLTKYLPSPLREIIIILLILWTLSLFGGFIFSGIPRVFLIILVIVILISFIGL